MPVGAYGGRADIMDHVLPAGQVFQAGTLSGNPLATAAGIATLKVLEAKTCPTTAWGPKRLELLRGIGDAAAAAGIPHTFSWVGSMFTLFFNSEKVVNQTVAGRSDTKPFARYFWGMLDRGFYLPCSQFEANFVSAVHTHEQIDQTLAAARAVLTELSG